MECKCPVCGEEFKGLGIHWSHNESHRPELCPYLLEVTCGILMGDGYMAKSEENYYLDVSMVNEEYLEFLDDVFGVFSLGVNYHRGSGDFNDNYNHQDVYRFRTRTHPDFKRFYEWYSTGEKVFPKNIPLSPTVLRHWYVGDGNMARENRIRISTVNEIENKNKIEDMFSRVGLPKPDYWSNGYAAWNAKGTKVLFGYMAYSPPGFERKFPEKYHI